MKRACVIGWPIKHSRSPIIHNYWLRQLGIAGDYTKQAVEPERLADFIKSLHGLGLEGCNVTIPHKERVFELVRPADENTRRIGTVNTVYWRDGISYGTTTDGEGFIANLRQEVRNLSLANRKVVILGAGGSALAITASLLDAGASSITMVNRSIERAESMRLRFGPAIIPQPWERRHDELSEAALLVNTTSLGMPGQPVLDIELHNLPADAVVTDIVYTPLITDLLQRAKARGLRIVPGLGMLLHQAVRGFELWFGRRPVVSAELYDLVASDIDPGYRR